MIIYISQNEATELKFEEASKREEVWL